MYTTVEELIEDLEKINPKAKVILATSSKEYTILSVYSNAKPPKYDDKKGKICYIDIEKIKNGKN